MWLVLSVCVTVLIVFKNVPSLSVVGVNLSTVGIMLTLGYLRRGGSSVHSSQYPAVMESDTVNEAVTRSAKHTAGLHTEKDSSAIHYT